MKASAYSVFSELRGEFRGRVSAWQKAVPALASLQDELCVEMGHDDYRIENPVVYNEALDEITETDEPAFVLVADNPGKNEQLSKNRRYLVGQSGKLAEGWFRRELGLDFRRDVIIINKTPVHTPRTAELGKLLAIADRRGSGTRRDLEALLRESQVEMARIAHRMHGALGVPLWISGYGELGPRGLFRIYADELTKAYADTPGLQEEVLLFRHFSMNQFAIEMKQKRDPELPLRAELARIGKGNRQRILGW
ncbi:MAG: hypothetical protein WCQ50_08910 [Spirochaetota bacterium]